jgi:ribosomal protein S18 acetylase RimI-like enzyme
MKDEPVALNALRAETAADQEFLFALYAATRQEELAAAGLTSPIREILLQQQFLAMSAGYTQAFPNARRWIIEREGRPIGRLIVHRAPNEYRIVDLALCPEFRGRGIGGEVIRSVQQEAASDGMPVRLQVAADNRARFLYSRLGFIETGLNELRVQMEWRAHSAVPS